MPATERARTAIVTGAGQGLGAAIARSLYEAGHAVVLADVREEAAREAAAALDPAGERAVGAWVDVRDRAAFERLLTDTIARFGHVDVLVNNAAVTISRPFFELEQEE